MKIKKIIHIIYILVLSSLFLFSCTKNNELQIVLDSSNPLALAPDVSWAVIIEPYVVFKADKSWDSQGDGHCRLGDILQVQGKSTDKNNEVWYLFKDGWISEDCVTVYNNRYKAQTLSKSLLNEKK